MVVGLIIMLILIIGLIIANYISDPEFPIIMFIIASLVSFGIGLTLWSIDIFDNAYREGQIDALTGKVKYELKTNPDSTKTWEYKIK